MEIGMHRLGQLDVRIEWDDLPASQWVERPALDPVDQLKGSVEMLDERSAAFDPITVIAIKHAAYFADLGMMDMAAHNTIDVTADRLVRHGLGKGRHVLHGILDAVLEMCRQRPIRVAKPPPNDVEMAVEPQRGGIGAVAEHRQPTGVLDDRIEHVAMDHQQAASVSRDVDCLVGDLDTAELQQRVIAQPFVVIAGYVNDARTLTNFAQNLLDDIVVGLRPVPGFLQAPAIDDIADQINRVCIVTTQEIDKEAGFASASAEVQIRNPDRSIATHRRDVTHRHRHANRTRPAPGAGCARLGSPLGRRSPAGPSATATRMRWSLEETGRPAPTTRDRAGRWLAEPPREPFNRQARDNG